MRGESSSNIIPTVVRNGSVGFNFTNMADFKIYSLTFTSYNRSLSYGSHPASNSGLLLRSTRNAKLVNCSFHDNLGTALAVSNTSITLAENNVFIRNKCVCQYFGDSEVRGCGCGITALNSTLTFTGNTSFHENTQTTSSSSYCGGAIWASARLLYFNGMNNFTGNSADFGGAVYAHYNITLTFHGTNNFLNNSASNGGGAIYADEIVGLTFHGTNNFLNNSAGYGGGAIYADENVGLTFHGTNNFLNNSASSGGGAIYAKINSLLSFNGTSDFEHNSAVFGGVFNAETNSLLSFIGTSDFSHNSADYGGAIYADVNVVLTFHGTDNFLNNSADYAWWWGNLCRCKCCT